jgi:hypothetical protein
VSRCSRSCCSLHKYHHNSNTYLAAGFPCAADCSACCCLNAARYSVKSWSDWDPCKSARGSCGCWWCWATGVVAPGCCGVHGLQHLKGLLCCWWGCGQGWGWLGADSGCSSAFLLPHAPTSTAQNMTEQNHYREVLSHQGLLLQPDKHSAATIKTVIQQTYYAKPAPKLAPLHVHPPSNTQLTA